MSAAVTFRPARDGDEPGIAAVHWAARRLAYKDILPRENLDGRTVEALTKEWVEILGRGDGAETLAAEDASGRILGFVTGGPVRPRTRPIVGDLSGVTAEVSLLYVLPEEMGKGLGRALFGRGVERLHRLGHRALVVWGHRDNPYLRFYERLGGLAAAESDWQVAGRLFPTRAYVWRGLPALVAACAAPADPLSLRPPRAQEDP
jgi:GNAT superfamily N-acetyltransferase